MNRVLSTISFFLICSILTIHADTVVTPDLSSQFRVLVQFSRPASADVGAQQREGVSSERLQENAVEQQNDFRNSLQESGLSHTVENSYTSLFNGVALNLSNREDAEKLKTLPGVLEVFPIRSTSIEPIMDESDSNPGKSEGLPNVPYPQFAHELSKLDALRRDHPNIKGDGVKVGVVDSGIDYTHPAFAIAGQKCESFQGSGCRVKFGRDLVGDKYDSEAIDPSDKIPVPDNDPADCNSHGTHVAGIIGGSDGRIQGVAPGVIFGAYRIFGCDGSTSDDIILAGMEAAYNDGMQIINLSLGGGLNDNSYPVAQAINRLSESGVLVIVSAGNDGEDGYGTISSPSVATKGFSVASYDNPQSFEKFMTVTGIDGASEVPFQYSTTNNITARFNETTEYTVIASPNNSANSGDACEPFEGSPFTNGVALVKRGECTFTTKVVNAMNAGAVGVLVYNNIPRAGAMSTSLDSKKANSPVGFMTNTYGDKLFQASKSNPSSVKIKFVNTEKLFPMETANEPSSFSGMGLDLNLLMKPDVGTPGGKIVSSVPVSRGSYKQLSGTSMAAPYLSGVMALDLQNKGPVPFLSRQRRIHITSRASIIPGSESNPIAYSVAKIGSGLIDVRKFILNNVDIEPSKLEFGDGNQERKHKIKVTNNGPRELKYTVSHLRSKSIRGIAQVKAHLMETEDTYASVSFSSDRFTVAPGNSVEFEVTVNPNALGPYYIRSGFIKLVEDSNTDGSGEISVPYALMTGEYSKIPIWGIKEMPALYTAQRGSDDSVPAFDGSVIPNFDLASNATSPAVMFGLDFPLRRLEITLWSLDSSSAVGFIDAKSYAQPTEENKIYVLKDFVYDMEDVSAHITVPIGQFTIRINTVLPRALTPVPDIKAATVNIYESPKFVINKAPSLAFTTTTASTLYPSPTSA